MSAKSSLPVSCVIYVLDEEVNLPHCLASLAWCEDVVVVDSFSKDRTEEICRAAGTRFFRHKFEGFGAQRNWSLDNIDGLREWVLVMDADERVPPEMVDELERLLPVCPREVGAYRMRRRFHLWGRWLKRSALYPTWVVRLIRVGRVRYVDRGHAETQIVDGEIQSLATDLIDENHKGVDDWWQRQVRYAAKEAAHELSLPRVEWIGLMARDPLRRREALKAIGRSLPLRPAWYFLYSFIWRMGFLDGVDGLRFCAMKAAYQLMIESKKRELRCADGGR